MSETLGVRGSRRQVFKVVLGELSRPYDPLDVDRVMVLENPVGDRWELHYVAVRRFVQAWLPDALSHAQLRASVWFRGCRVSRRG